MHRISPSVRFVRKTHRRLGLTTPAVAIALLAMLLGFALIIDRIWLETAKVELRTAAEAAALAAGRELASDDLLRPDAAVDERLNNARQSAAEIAAENFVCGSPLLLDAEPEGDIRIGYVANDRNGIHFVESTGTTTSVVVRALRTRANNNPVAMIVAGATNLPFGDVATRAQATIRNDVVGLCPIEGSPIPALPVGIWEVDPSGDRDDTWDNQIESRNGTDKYSFDEITHSVVPGADGIPEMVLKSMRVGQDPAKANMLLLDLGTQVDDSEVTRQFKSGISVKDLENHDGMLWLGQGSTIDLTATPDFDGAQLQAFEEMIGECRICFLYSKSVPKRQPPDVTATCTQIVAVRILAVNGTASGSCDVTVQPTVMTTRTAVLSTESPPTQNESADTLAGALDQRLVDEPSNSAGNSLTHGSSLPTATRLPNKYVYKLQLTH